MAVTGVSSPKKIAQTLGECLIVGASGVEFSSGTSCELTGSQQGQAHRVEGGGYASYQGARTTCSQSQDGHGMDTAVQLRRETLHTGLPGEEVSLLSQSFSQVLKKGGRQGPQDDGSCWRAGTSPKTSCPSSPPAPGAPSLCTHGCPSPTAGKPSFFIPRANRS